MRATAEHLEPFRRWRTSYRSEGRELAGFWLTPDGDGPHPAVVFNHGSIGFGPASLASLQVLLGLGYAVFAPIRRGHNEEPGPVLVGSGAGAVGQPGNGPAARGRLAGRTGRRVGRGGVGRGAARGRRRADRGGRLVVRRVLTVLALSEPAPLCAGVSFAGPSMSWPDAPALQAELLAAAASGTAPLFLAQAFNDHSLQPTYAIGAELARCGRPHETRVYPATGAVPGYAR